ncbi:MAG: sugar phosphate isomerase/epimerase [Clostridiales bacterium]|nr:MAG: sugar phosphate isomerase/epimerase [Clostridiales bacterium]
MELTYSLGLDPNFDVSSLDESVRLGGVKYLQNIIRKMKIGGGTLLSGVSYAGWGTPNVIMDSKEAYLNQSVKSMREIVKVAEECGVTYCVEAVNRFETCLINTAKEAVDYCDMIDSPNIGVLLDTYHMNIEEKQYRRRDKIRRQRQTQKLPYGRKQPHRAGQRTYRLGRNFFKALSDIGYEGRIVSEPFVMQGGEVGRDIHVFRDLVEKSDRRKKLITKQNFFA